MKTSDLVVEILLAHGVKYVFTLPGGFSMHLNDSIGHSQLTPIYCLHESGAGFSACGYAAYSGKLGVCVVTSGPGSTNILTAVASAWQDSLPLLVISGDGKVANIEMRHKYQLRQGGQQDVPIIEMVRPITKKVFLMDDPLWINVLSDLIELDVLTPRRGPVWLSIPLDVQGMEV